MIKPFQIALGQLVFSTGDADVLFHIAHAAATDAQVTCTTPLFQVDGVQRGGFSFVEHVSDCGLPDDGREVVLRYRAPGTPELTLLVRLRGYADSPIVRWQYQLWASVLTTLTKSAGADDLCYLTLQTVGMHEHQLTDIQLSHFDRLAHTYLPSIETYPADDCYDGQAFAGPIVLFHNDAHTLLLAYEHGADHPDSFLGFRLRQDDDRRTLQLAARKGNYYDGQVIGPDTPWESVWFELGRAPLPFAPFLQRYRQFVLDELCEQRESRQPYLFYNTWNYQERNRYFNNRPYLESMHQERMLGEIDVAHRLGIDVFVIDTGWYQKTGDWQVNLERFPDGLRSIKQRLDSYGMRLGLWFNPTVAALTSDVYARNPEWEMTRNGQPTFRHQVWETEESAALCLCSDYADAHIATMIRLREELGVTYFKWDGIQQYGCDSPLHHHGTAANTAVERADCYAYQMGRQLIRIVAEVTRRYPDVIVDFDITEAGRFGGLGFLSVGKYFLINNGPYFSDFDIPRTVAMTPDTINVFFYPGAARPRICRRGAQFDPIIPAILLLTHFLPDGPPLAQHNSLAALTLGGNGIWGDLLALSEADIAPLADGLASYKQVARAATRAYPRAHGFIGASPEIHEKIALTADEGLVAFFTVAACTLTHVTQPLRRAARCTVNGADSWETLADGRLKVTVQLAHNDARVVFIRSGS